MATGAASLALFGGVQVAQAGIGDVVNDPVGAVENALPNPEDAGAVVEDVTVAVDEATGSIDAEAAVSKLGRGRRGTRRCRRHSRERRRTGKKHGREPDGNDQRHRRQDARRQGRRRRHKEPRSGRFEHRLVQGQCRRFRGAIRSGATGVQALLPGPVDWNSRECACLFQGRTGSHAHARPAGLDRVLRYGADRPERHAVGSGRLDAPARADAGFGEAGQGFLRGSGCAVRSASSWRPTRDGPLRRRGSRSRTSRCAFQRALLLGPEDRPVGSAWTEPRTGRTLPFSPRTPRLGRQLP